MTKEEKAKEICETYANSKFIPTPEECVAYSSAMIMAEWTEEQIIEKAVEWFNENFYEHPHCNSHICTDIAESMDDLADKFQKAMKGE